jgi:glycerol-3-phosphate dehydrogenase
MESREFALVASLCRSRNELLDRFPSMVREIRFFTSIPKGFRHHPRLLWAGCWLYWLIGAGKMRTPRFLSVADLRREEPLVNNSDCSGGIEYSDAYLHDNDARFVFRFIRLALDRGCVAANYVECNQMQRGDDGRWRIGAVDLESGTSLDIRARVVVNATGAFVDGLNALGGVDTRYCHALSKGVHLVVPRITECNRVLAFFADDGRLFFAIPMAHRTCIGTTDTRVTQAVTRVTAEDRRFILENINRRLALAAPLTEADIISERCGVRPLALEKGREAGDDFLQLSRKHFVEVSPQYSHVSIFGGKLTDCLNVGDEVCDRVKKLGIPLAEGETNWYGAESGGDDLRYRERAKQLGLDGMTAEDTGEPLDQRLWRRYGSDAMRLLELIAADSTMTQPALAGTGIRRCELAYLREREMIVKLEDFLRRRSKIELLYGRNAIAAMEGFRETARLLFDDEADFRIAQYLSADDNEHDPERNP